MDPILRAVARNMPSVDAFAPRFGYAQVALVVAAAAFVLSTFLRGPDFNPWLDIGLYFSCGVLAAFLCLARGLVIKDAESRTWLIFGIGIVVFNLGDFYWTLLYAEAEDSPMASFADVGFLAFYVATYIAVVGLLRTRLTRTPRSVWLDGIVGGLGAASIAATAFFAPIAQNATGDRLAQVILNLSYPIGDLLLLALVVLSFSATGWRPDRSWILLGVGVALMALTDTVYLFQTAKETYVGGTLVDAGWPVVFACIGLAPWRRPKTVDVRVFEHWTAIAMPLVFGFSSLMILTGGQMWNSPTLATALAFLAIVVGFIRVALTFREVRSLSESRREARTDELTMLGNRRLFYETATGLLRGRTATTPLALLLIDLDRFKEVNDSLGHQFGDKLLLQIGPRLSEAIRNASVIARLGGDEFAVVIDGADEQAAVDAARRISSSLDSPFVLDGVPVQIGASIGIALYPAHASDVNSLLRHADIAMYSAKGRHDTGHAIYEARQDEHSRARLNTINELRRALERRELIVHYQPKINAHTGRLAGAEALVRLFNPRTGITPPDRFLPLAEQAGLMRMLTSHVLDIVLDDVARWARLGHRVKVAVNLSVTNLLDAEFPDHVAEALRKRRLPGRCLTFEITETTVMSDPERALAAVNRLRALGSDISLDDYGTGYASIAYLRQMPLNEIKLDRSFVNNLESDEVAKSFFTSTVMLAHTLKLRVVAEGVETPAMWAAVREAGCDVGQGYLFSKPIAFDEFSASLIRANSASKIDTPTPIGNHV